MESSQYFWLRSTGFPIQPLTQLGRFSALALCSHIEQNYRALRVLRTHLLQSASDFSPQACRKLIRKLNENQSIQTSDLPDALRGPLADQLSRWNELLVRVEAREPAERQYQNYLESARQNLITFLDDDAIAEALFISNPAAHTRIRELIRDRHGKNDSRKKQKLRLGWSYTQRFCAKNDTSSFFGPLAWGQFDNAQEDNILLTQGEGSWIKDRQTWFESWAVQRLVEQVNLQCPSTELMPLQLNQGCYVQDQTLFMPIGKNRPIDALTAQVLAYVSEAEHALPTFSALLRSMPEADAPTLARVVEHLVKQRILRRGWHVSPREGRPIEKLQRFVAVPGMPKPFTRLWHSRLQALEAARLAYAQGALMQRADALETLNGLLNEAGVDVSREAGAMYVGRYPVYEDCARNVQLTLGKGMLDQINEQLAPLMRIHQWLVKAIAQLLHAEFNHAWEQLEEAAPGSPVDFLHWLHRFSPQLPVVQARIIATLDQRLERVWGKVLQPFSGEREVRLSTAHIDTLLSELQKEQDVAGFEVFGSEYHSPDFLLSSASVEAINQGLYEIIVGEVHPAVHTLSQPVAAPFSPFNAEINEQVAALFQRPRLLLADSPDSYQRSHIDWPLQSSHLQLVLPSGGGCVPAAQQFAAGRAKIRRSAGRLQVVDVFGQFEEDLMCVYATPLHQLAFALAGSAVAKTDNRRIWLDHTLYKRASWLFSTDQLPKPAASIDELEHVLQWRAWAQEQGLPRYTFIKIDTEPKPQFIDFENPLSLDGITNALNKAGQVKFSEMRPNPEELWLAEHRGAFCAEFRTTFTCNETVANGQ